MMPLIPDDRSMPLELLAECPVISCLACIFVFTLQRFYARSFFRNSSLRARLVLRAAATFGIIACFLRIYFVNSQYIPLLALMFAASLVGLAIGIGVIWLLRRAATSFRKRNPWGLFVFFAGVPLVMAVVFLVKGGEDNQSVAGILALLGTAELVAAASFRQLRGLGRELF